MQNIKNKTHLCVHDRKSTNRPVTIAGSPAVAIDRVARPCPQKVPKKFSGPSSFQRSFFDPRAEKKLFCRYLVDSSYASDVTGVRDTCCDEFSL